MKKSILFAAAVMVLSLCTSVNAQNFRFGVKASGTLNNIYMEDTTTTTMKPSFNVGVLAEYFLNENMSLGAEVLFAQQGCQEKHEGENLLGKKWTSKKAVTTNHINIPILFRYYIGALAIEVGPQFSLCLGGKYTETYEVGDDKTETTMKFNEYEDQIRKGFSDYKFYNRLNIGGAIGVNYNMPMGLFFGARYTYDFTNFYNTIDNEGSELKNKSIKSNHGVIAVSVGFKF